MPHPHEPHMLTPEIFAAGIKAVTQRWVDWVNDFKRLSEHLYLNISSNLDHTKTFIESKWLESFKNHMEQLNLFAPYKHVLDQKHQEDPTILEECLHAFERIENSFEECKSLWKGIDIHQWCEIVDRGFETCFAGILVDWSRLERQNSFLFFPETDREARLKQMVHMFHHSMPPHQVGALLGQWALSQYRQGKSIDVLDQALEMGVDLNRLALANLCEVRRSFLPGSDTFGWHEYTKAWYPYLLTFKKGGFDIHSLPQVFPDMWSMDLTSWMKLPKDQFKQLVEFGWDPSAFVNIPGEDWKFFSVFDWAQKEISPLRC